MAKRPTYTSVEYYLDHGQTYLQLHARSAPVGHYKPEISDDMYDMAVQFAVQDFEREHDIEIFQLGRSGRHICIADTPRNYRRYASLQRKANIAADALWASMRTI